MTNSIPEDFPREAPITALGGAQPKLAVRRDAATGLYVSTLSDEELAERHDICEDLAQQIVAKCKRNRETKYAALTELQILERLLKQLLVTNWGSDEEMRWIIRRTAAVLQWQAPASAAIDQSTASKG